MRVAHGACGRGALAGGLAEAGARGQPKPKYKRRGEGAGGAAGRGEPMEATKGGMSVGSDNGDATTMPDGL